MIRATPRAILKTIAWVFLLSVGACTAAELQQSRKDADKAIDTTCRLRAAQLLAQDAGSD